MESFDTQKYIDTLKKIGLDEREAEIYLSAVKIGGGTITEISESANMERTSIYYHIGSLIKSDLLTLGSRGKRTIYLPADPHRLKKLYEKKEKEFLGILPEIKQRYLKETSKSIQESFQGKKDMPSFFESLYEIIKESQEAEEELYIIDHSYEVIKKSLRGESAYDPPEELSTKVKAILPKSEKKKNPEENRKDPYLVAFYSLPEAERKYLPDKYFFKGAIVISQKKILTFDHNTLFGNITENKDLAQTWRMFFEFMWDKL